MNQVKFENPDKGLCVICDKPISKGRMTCSKNCHEGFIKFCETQFGIAKKVVDSITGIAYRVPTRDIIENGLSWKNLTNFPQWKEDE